jgi:hypothetical protein
MENTMFQDRFNQVVGKDGSIKRFNDSEAGNSDRKLHIFASHLFRKWMLYDPENRERYFRHVLSNVREVEGQNMSLLLTKTEKIREHVSVSNAGNPL